MECASGFIATAQYIAYITEDNSYVHHSGIAFAMCVCNFFINMKNNSHDSSKSFD